VYKLIVLKKTRATLEKIEGTPDSHWCNCYEACE